MGKAQCYLPTSCSASSCPSIHFAAARAWTRHIWDTIRYGVYVSAASASHLTLFDVHLRSALSITQRDDSPPSKHDARLSAVLHSSPRAVLPVMSHLQAISQPIQGPLLTDLAVSTNAGQSNLGMNRRRKSKFLGTSRITSSTSEKTRGKLSLLQFSSRQLAPHSLRLIQDLLTWHESMLWVINRTML